ncbi:SDR family NAD(P)-dependent oxidoreductase [Nocardia sp. NPDC046473]|uniref:SDR family NAD(P)-dependent oxidoreductase n=1 Tax=Nocardia sp. NPDC046473 TaxID=3155733 RepID=UPI0033CD1882
MAESGVDTVVVPALRADRGEPEALLSAVAELFVSGREIDWVSVLDTMGVRGRRIALPTYAFQRDRYWLQPGDRTDPAVTAGSSDAAFWQVVEQGDVQELMATLDPTAGTLSTQDGASMLSVLAAWRRDQRARSAVDGWRYRVVWKPRTHTPQPTLSGRWLVAAAADAGGVEDCATTLRRHGADVVVVRTPSDSKAADRIWWHTVLADLGELAGVVSLLGLDDRPHPEHPALTVGLSETLALVHGLGDTNVDASLWCLTRGAVSVGETDALAAPAQALVWGLGRVVALEQPQRWGGLVDLPVQPGPHDWDLLCGILSGADTEDQLAVRSSGVFLRRLVPAPVPPGRYDAWTPTGTVLITGGTGALGTHTARWIAGYGTARIVLLSRGGPGAPGAAALVEELSAAGTPAEIVACDVADRDALVRVLDAIPEQAPLTAVFHAAGVSETAPVADLDVASLARVVYAKVGGAQALHEVLADRADLDRLVLFSSGAGVWGGGDQGAYSAGNAFLDALAEYRRGAGMPATSVAWGPWADGGMVDGAADRMLDRRGLRTMAPGTAIAALRTALAVPDSAVTVADVDWARFHLLFAMARPRPLLHDLPGVAGQLAEASGTGDSSLLAPQLAGLDPARQHGVVLALVKTCAAAVLGYAEPTAISSERSFRDLGFDSLTALELRDRLRAATGLQLPATLVFDCPTPEAMTAEIREMVVGGNPADGAASADQQRFWAALENVQYDKLLDSGVVATVLELLRDEPNGDTGADTIEAEIDDMDVGELLNIAARNRAARNLTAGEGGN